MRMTFDVSSSVTLLFDFWDVHGPAEMLLSVFVVLLLTIFYEVLKVWRATSFKLHQSAYSEMPSAGSDGSSVLEGSQSESSLTPMQAHPAAPTTSNRWLLHLLQTVVHMLQVSLGYMLMLCVMSYNTWIFLGVVLGSVVGYFLAFPLLGLI